MFRKKGRREVKPQKILATGGAVGVSLAMVLLALSVVVVSLRKVRLTVDVNQDKDLEKSLEALEGLMKRNRSR